MDAGCQYRSRAMSSTVWQDYYYGPPCARPKTSDGSAPFGAPRLRFPPRPDVTYRCEPTPPDPAAHWQRASPNPPSSPPMRVVREETFKPVHKQTIEEWVDEQIHLMDRSNHEQRRARPMEKEELRQRMWDELVYEYEAEAHKWMNREADMRRRALEREREEARRRVVQEDVRRIQARVRQRRDSEKEVIAEERRRSVERAQEKVRREQARVERAVQEAWQAYESGWAALSSPSSSSSSPSSSEPLGFRDIPWPVLVAPTRGEELTPEHITAFLLHPAHSPNHSRRDRIRAALLRWHPDRFRRILTRVAESERSEVDESVGVIARCLNELLAKEGKALQQTR